MNQTCLKNIFFALYWNQEYKFNSGGTFIINARAFPMNPNGDEFLELKSLDKITDDEAKQMHRGIGKNYTSAQEFLEDNKVFGFLSQNEVDYLRSRGYAVPFMNYSVSDLIEMGWIKIKK